MTKDMTKIKTWTIRTLKILTIVIGLYFIYTALQIVIHGNWSAFQTILSGITKVMQFCIPYLLLLITKSLVFLWLPILAYILIGIVTTSKWWRFYLCLSVLAAAIIILNNFVFSKLSISLSTLKQVPDVLLYILVVQNKGTGIT